MGLSGNICTYIFFRCVVHYCISCHCPSSRFDLARCDPNALCISCHYPSFRFDFSRCDPSGFKCLNSVSIEANTIASIRYSFHSSSMVFTKSGSFRVIVDSYF